MKPAISRPCLFNIFVVTLAALCLSSFVASAQAQSVTWQFLPFPVNSDWPGPQGTQATTNGTVLTLQGWPVITAQTFSPGITISFDMVLQARDANDGGFNLFFAPTGQPANIIGYPNTQLGIEYRNYAPDGLDIWQSAAVHVSTLLWGEAPFTFAAQTNYHVIIGVAANGQLSLTINGQVYSLPNTAIVPLNQFQIELFGWQPTNIFHVDNFTVTPANTCPNILGTWSGQLNVADPQSGFRTTTLSLQVTDQTTNGCLLRGFINTGNSRCPGGPWGWFSNGGWWGKLPFTGTVLDQDGVLLNFGIFGQASAILDLSQSPPVMKKFVLQSTAGAANGNTAVGDLTKQPSGP